jgi:uncharacterized protein YjbJ (UPF0337 family)
MVFSRASGRKPSRDARRRDIMWNKDEMKGKGEQAKGKVKEAAGDLTGNERLKGEGEAEQATGKVQEGYGTAKRKVGETIEDAGEKIKK